MAEYFTRDQLIPLREAYTRFDNDSDGTITTRELEQIIKYLGYNISEAQLIKLIISIECEAGALDFTDFLEIVSKIMKSLQIKIELIREFRDFDKNGSGRIGIADLREIIMKYGRKLKDYEADELIKKADIDEDGCTVYEEFLEMMIEY
ncbi:unnamed protein product [Blepharisma stoltei]|uniref:Calmodulin n=1 Tax=Blepharisma stoltei TaxID=1481888 RepID=A0AAU9JEF4_9CILI|nr:unnamed protein product [Blepharisma stoltei]